MCVLRGGRGLQGVDEVQPGKLVEEEEAPAAGRRRQGTSNGEVLSIGDVRMGRGGGGSGRSSERQERGGAAPERMAELSVERAGSPVRFV